MLYPIVAMLVLLWLIGLATSTILGGLIHLLLIVALFVFAVNLMNAKST